MAEFDEAQHPRAPDGKFGAGGGGAKPTGDAKAKPKTARSKATAAKAKQTAARAAAKAKAQAIVAKAKERAAGLKARASAMQPRGTNPSKEAKGKVSAARAAARAKAKEIVEKAKARAQATIAKAAGKSPAKASQPAGKKQERPGPKPTRPAADQPAKPEPSARSRTEPTATRESAKPATGPSAAKPMTAGDFKAAVDRTYSKATPDELEATKMYAGPYFSHINKSLREPGAKVREAAVAEHSVKNLDSLMDKSRTASDIVTYRGAEEHPAFANLKVGETFTDDAFVSTAVDQRAAFGGTHLFHITSPAGTKVAPIAGGSSELEGEMLIGRGAQMRLDKIEQRTHPEHGYPQTVMHFTVVGQR